LEFEDIMIYNSGASKFVSIRLTSDSGDVFGEQTEAAALDYGKRLLKDTIKYFGGQECSASVHEVFYTSDPFEWNDEWYHVGSYSTSRHGWYVSHSFVRAYFIGGQEKVKVWNYK
jgi:hypothetical protein